MSLFFLSHVLLCLVASILSCCCGVILRAISSLAIIWLKWGYYFFTLFLFLMLCMYLWLCSILILTEPVWKLWLVVFLFVGLKSFIVSFVLYLRNGSALAVKWWVINHCLEVSCKEDQINKQVWQATYFCTSDR